MLFMSITGKKIQVNFMGQVIENRLYNKYFCFVMYTIPAYPTIFDLELPKVGQSRITHLHVTMYTVY